MVTVTAMDGRFMGGAQRGLHVVGTAILINRRFKIGDHWRFVGGGRRPQIMATVTGSELENLRLEIDLTPERRNQIRDYRIGASD